MLPRFSHGMIAAGLSGLSKDSAAAGATTYDVSPPAATTEATAAGVALGAKTFGAFGGADAGLIDGYTARTVNAVGSTSWSGSGLGTYTPSGGADGDAGVLALDATIGGVVVATALHDYSRAAAAGGGSLATILDIDWAALHAAYGAYDFLVDGPAGDGTHTYGGYTLVLVGSSQVTQLEVTANGLEMAQNTGGAFQLGVNLRDLGTAIDPAGPCHVLTRVASATSGAAGDGVQVGAQRDATLGNWTKGDAVVRYRKADATPDLYFIVYNGSTYDVNPSGTLAASGDVRMQVGLTALYSSVGRGDTGTATDPADWDTLGEFADVSYSDAIGAFAGTYPANADLWAFVGCGNSGSGTFKTLTAYGLTA